MTQATEMKLTHNLATGQMEIVCRQLSIPYHISGPYQSMSYMKSGRANRWATCKFEQEAKAGRLHFLNWDDFKDEFRKDFMLLDAEAAAINVLETTTYFQGNRSVDDYLNQFRDLIYDSGY